MWLRATLLLVVGLSLTTALVSRATPSGASGPTVTGGGSSWAALALNQWVADVSAPQFGSLNVSYSTTSSVLGLNEFAQNQINFGVSEIGYSTGQADDVPPSGDAYQYLPAVGGADCLMYNLAGSTGPINGLQLNSSVLAGIFTGEVTKWNDPSIEALNQGIALPSTPITVVYRTEPAGDNYVFSDYLNTLDPAAWGAYTAKLGTAGGPQSIWPVPQGSGNYAPYDFSNWIGESGSDNASNYVAGNGGSITYVETGYAIEHNIPCASVQNAAGLFVQPSESNDAIALEGDQLQADLEQDLTGVFTNPQATAYPISAYGYFITQEGQTPTAIGTVLGTFLKFVACQGQRQAGQLGYTPLPPNLVQDDFDAIGRINGAANPGAVNATNCPNPYVTGALAPVTGPSVAGQTAAAAPASSAGAGGGAQAGAASAAAAAAAQAKAAKEQAAKALAAQKEAEAVVLNGQALASAVTHGPSVLGSASTIVWWALGLLLLLAVPATLLALRKRSRSQPEGPS
jgi:phosphate transport system substrate-binding protein